MKITYVMMQYPLPTQTFAMSDIAGLRDLGHDVEVQCLLPATKEQKRLCATYRLDEMQIRNATVAGYLLGIPLLAKYVVQNLSFFVSVFRDLGRRPRRLGAFLLLLPRIAELVSILSRRPPDVVHAFWGHWPSVVPALVKRYAPGVRTSTHMGAYDLYAGFPLGLTADLVDECFTHSVSNLPRIKALGVTHDVHMVHRGIPLGDLSALDPAGNPIEKVAAQFCTASALTKDKHVDVCIKVFALIKRQVPSAQLVVVGDGPERQNLQDLARTLGIGDAVCFAGYMKRQELFRVMCGSEFFLFFSQKISERLPNVVKEAMFAKCLCLVSTTQGIEELVPGPDYGSVFGHADCESIAEEILRAMAQPSRSQEVGENAYSLVAEHFSSASAMRKYTEIWGRSPSIDGAG